jgi:translation machinery-associated protein 16
MTKTSEKTKAAAVKKAAKGKQKAEKIFHPESRKAGQMEREALRKAKLANKLVKRGKKQMVQGERRYLQSYDVQQTE